MTDDEREADEKAILNALYDSRESFSGGGEEVGIDETAILVDHVPEIVRGLGFRRSEVPEPRVSAGSAFPTTDEVRDVWVDHMSLMPDDVPAFQEIFDDWLARTLKEAGAENSAGTVKTVPELSGLERDNAALALLADRPDLDGFNDEDFPEEERGEPSDAQVEAAWAVIERDGLTVLERSHVRDALRAAFAVGEGGVQ